MVSVSSVPAIYTEGDGLALVPDKARAGSRLRPGRISSSQERGASDAYLEFSRANWTGSYAASAANYKLGKTISIWKGLLLLALLTRAAKRR